MDIREGRHILHEMVTENYVKNDVSLGVFTGGPRPVSPPGFRQSEDDDAANIVSSDRPVIR
jgi:hypothetical protein